MYFLVAAGLWVLFSSFGLLLLGFRSKSLLYWIIAIIIFPFLYVMVEGVGELFRKLPPFAKIRTAIDEKTKEKSFSVTRIAYILLETLILTGLIIGAWYFGAILIRRFQ